MSGDPSRLFLSGSNKDFRQVRLDLDAALSRGGCHVIHEADFPQVTSDALLKLARLIEPCGIVVHLIGVEPGSIPFPKTRAEYLDFVGGDGKFLAHQPALRASLGDFSTVTHTQWEAYIAIHLGIPLLVYADASHDSPTHPQRTHLDLLREINRYPTSFKDHPTLHRWVMADLMAHFRLNAATAGIASVIQPFNLPGGYIGQVFLGREEFLETLRQSLTGGGHAAAITQKAVATGISGLGGIGKTHAAVAYADLHRADYTALLFVSADTPEKLNSSLADLCGVLRLDENGELPPDESIRMRASLDWLAKHPGWLLIIDNVDDEAAALALTALLGQLTAGHVLVTSRLHNWSRQVKTLDLTVLSEDVSSELILELTADHRRTTASDETQARELARLLDGLPLAIQQAAGFINEQTITLADYINRFREQAADLLSWFSNSLIPYAGPVSARPEDIAPRPVLITWKASFDQLSEDDRECLLLFSHFGPEPIPEFLLEPTDGCTPELKTSLRAMNDGVTRAGKYSLITRSRSEPFFKIHRLVQQITRLHASEAERFSSMRAAISLIWMSEPGDPSDVRSWTKWNPLEPHAIALSNHASDDFPPERLSWLNSQLGSLFNRKGLFGESETFLRRALKIDRAAYGDDHPEVATCLNNLAQLLQVTNRLAEAESMMRDSIRINRAIYGDNHPRVSIVLSNLGQLLLTTNRMAEAELLMRESLCIHRAAYGDDHPDVAVGLNCLANLLLATNRLPEAEPMMRDALRIDRAVYGEDHPTVATRLNNLAQLLQATNRLSEAEPMMQDALSINRAAYGENHPKVATGLRNLAGLLQSTNRLSEAEPMIREALRINRAFYGEDHPEVAACLGNLAQLLQATNRLSEAEPMMRDALRIDLAVYGDNHPNVATGLNNLALLLYATDRLAEAEPMMRSALHIDRAAYGDDHPIVANRINNLAGLLHATDRLSEAMPMYLDAVRIFRASLGSKHPYTVEASRNLEILLIELADLPQEIENADLLPEAESETQMRDALRDARATYGENHPEVAACLRNLARLLRASDRPYEAMPLYVDAVKILHSSLGPRHPDTVAVSGDLGVLQKEMSHLPPRLKQPPEKEIPSGWFARVSSFFRK